MGHAGWQSWRSFTSDSSVTKQKLAPGTLRRIIRFAAPYRRELIIFLALVVVDAVIGTLNPLIFREIINKGILGHRVGLVEVLALVIAGLAIAAAALSLVQRYYSVRVGEGLIYDMRSKVFEHIQRMPIAFFTRTQTG
ncbi:MAG: ABC transporter transmembrane domain-containing protein, partial [Actinomycetota bacterium]|nr:ABC transporter transmembrane domain-containing protein [Actinomycetota bacterium]